MREEEIGRHRIDLLVDETLVLETKSTHELPRIATRQLYNSLHAFHLDVGLLLHFGPEPCFYRVVNRRGTRGIRQPAP